MIRLALFAAVLLTGCQSALVPAPPDADRASQVVEAAWESGPATDRDALVLSPNADGTWTASYTFAEAGTEWVFLRSRGDYRTSTWTPLSESAEIVRDGGFDRIRLAEPGTTARFRFRPTAGPLDRTYDPALVFSDGSTALLMDQFSVLPLAMVAGDLATEVANPGDLDVPRPCLDVTFDTDARIVAGGDIAQGPYRLEPFCEPSPSYVYVGDLALTGGDAVTGVIDPGLPDWLREDLEPRLLQSFAALEERFGGSLEATPAVLLSFGTDPIEGLSQSGSVLPGMLVFSLSGTAFDAPNERLSRYLDWFLAHEGTHVFQIREGRRPTEAQWLPEGHASALAYDVVAARDSASAAWVAGQIAEESTICGEVLAGTVLADALRSEPYTCGQRVWRALVSGDGSQLAGLWDAMQEAAGDSPTSPEHLASVLPASKGQALLASLAMSGPEAFDILER